MKGKEWPQLGVGQGDMAEGLVGQTRRLGPGVQEPVEHSKHTVNGCGF